jgi:hypothetical protein
LGYSRYWNFANVSASVEDGIAAISPVTEVARPGQADNGPLLQNTQRCRVSFPSFNERLKCWYLEQVTLHFKPIKFFTQRERQAGISVELSVN